MRTMSPRTNDLKLVATSPWNHEYQMYLAIMDGRKDCQTNGALGRKIYPSTQFQRGVRDRNMLNEMANPFPLDGQTINIDSNMHCTPSNLPLKVELPLQAHAIRCETQHFQKISNGKRKPRDKVGVTPKYTI